MPNLPDLLKAIRSGKLSDVSAALDGGVDLDDNNLGALAIGMACFLGYPAIVRELALRGVKVNLPDNAVATSPLSMAARGGQKEVIRQLIELGGVLPPNYVSGLTEQEITVAQWMAVRDGHADHGPDRDTHAAKEAAVEEIELNGVSGVNTHVLESEAMRLAIRGE